MKILICAFLLAVLAASVNAAESQSDYVAETISSTETFRSKVLKVHHFTEGDFDYLAYTVTWRGHEVIVPASSANGILKEGDEIRCMMRSSPAKVGDTAKASLSFSIVSSRPYSADEARLRAVEAEAKRRRTERGIESPK